MGMTTLALAAFMWDFRDGMQVTRYKSGYTIYRPDDPDLRMYPKSYITDNKLLPSNHPTKLEDCDGLPEGRCPVNTVHYSATAVRLR